MTVTTTTRKRVRRAGSTPTELNRHLSAAADLQRQIQQLELELQGHRSWLLAHLQATGEKSATLGAFTASLRSRANWDYSPALAREMLRLKNEQKLEQVSGAATNSPTPYVALTFKVTD
jgi:hypothetical protein